MLTYPDLTYEVLFQLLVHLRPVSTQLHIFFLHHHKCSLLSIIQRGRDLKNNIIIRSFFQILASLCLPAILKWNNADIHTRRHLPVTCQQEVQTQRLGSLVQTPKITSNIYANFTIREVNIGRVYVLVYYEKGLEPWCFPAWAVVHNYTQAFATLLSYQHLGSYHTWMLSINERPSFEQTLTHLPNKSLVKIGPFLFFMIMRKQITDKVQLAQVS